MIFRTKWLIERAGNLTWPWASFGSVRTKLVMKCNWKLDKSLLSRPALQRPRTRRLNRQVFPLPVYKTVWRSDVLVRSFQLWTACRRHWSFLADEIGGLLSKPPTRQNKFPAVRYIAGPYASKVSEVTSASRFNALCWEKKWFVELTLPGTPVNSTVPQQRSQLETLGRPLSVKTEHVHAARGWIQWSFDW